MLCAGAGHSKNRVTSPKKDIFYDFFGLFPYIRLLAGPNIAEKGAANVVNAGFWRLKAPITSIWAPEGAFGLRIGLQGLFFTIFSAFFLNIWPLARPNIAKKGGPLHKLAREDRQTHFGTFNFWLKPGF